MCSVQFCPVGDKVKAMVDANASVSSQERAAEETALLGLFCNLHSLTAALWIVALLQYAQMSKDIQIREKQNHQYMTQHRHPHTCVQ